MTIAIPVARQKLIERIATSSRRLRKRADPLPADEFIRQYYHGVAEEDLAAHPHVEQAPGGARRHAAPPLRSAPPSSAAGPRPPRRSRICASARCARIRNRWFASTTPRKPATA